jgi:hypothetical protein
MQLLPRTHDDQGVRRERRGDAAAEPLREEGIATNATCAEAAIRQSWKSHLFLLDHQLTAATFRSRADGSLRSALGAPCQIIRATVRDLELFEGRGIKKLQDATRQVESISDTMGRLIALMARSRAVELDIISGRFGVFINPDLLDKMRKDLKDLEESAKKTEAL